MPVTPHSTPEPSAVQTKPPVFSHIPTPAVQGSSSVGNASSVAPSQSLSFSSQDAPDSSSWSQSGRLAYGQLHCPSTHSGSSWAAAQTPSVAHCALPGTTRPSTSSVDPSQSLSRASQLLSSCS